MGPKELKLFTTQLKRQKSRNYTKVYKAHAPIQSNDTATTCKVLEGMYSTANELNDRRSTAEMT